MTTLFHARSVDPATVTPADVVAILAEHKISPGYDGIVSFFEPDITYQRGADTFHCLAVGMQRSGNPVALGYLPVNLAGVRTWEFAYLIPYDWARGWAKTRHATFGTSNPGEEIPS